MTSGVVDDPSAKDAPEGETGIDSSFLETHRLLRLDLVNPNTVTSWPLRGLFAAISLAWLAPIVVVLGRDIPQLVELR